MVGLPRDSSTAPVAISHSAIHQPGATVSSVLSSLQPPPLSAIPFIDSPSARPGCWAQCLAMVQDIWDAEIFVASSPAGNSGLLVENAAATNDPRAILAERLPIYLVSPPGESSWVREARNPGAVRIVPNASNPSRPKRPRDDGEAVQDSAMEDVQSAAHSGASTRAAAAPSAAPTPEKRTRPSGPEVGVKGASGLGLNLPLPGQPGAFAVVAKLYDAVAGRELKVNTLVRCVGILQDHLPVAVGEDAFAEEFSARNPSIVKRLHVVQMHEAAEWEMNPVTSAIVASGGEQAFKAARQELKSVLPGLREMVVKYLASALFDDMIAAEYLLMGLLSRPAQRIGTGTALGKLSVNLVVPNEAADSNPDFMSNLSAALESLVPAVVPVELNIPSLNAQELFPKKDYTFNRLKAGPLQLTGGAILLADETKLTNGQLAERGLKNVRAMTSIAKHCTAPLDFKYYEAEVPVCCTSLFVSKGGKSIIPTDVMMRAKPDTSLKLQGWRSYDEELIRKMRLAMALLAEEGEFDISEEASKAVENEYVLARKNGHAKDGQETLQGWLSVARCCARSFGESTLTPERWLYAKELEVKRTVRSR